jgi:hypothetical protein
VSVCFLQATSPGGSAHSILEAHVGSTEFLSAFRPMIASKDFAKEEQLCN